MGKAIYKPKGKAGEYAEWACNLYVGCSNDCSYCYCKRGVLGHVMGGPVPKLKSCFRDHAHALEVFQKELDANLDALKKSSLFFTFSSDPMIPETRRLNWDCIVSAVLSGVRVQVLTKNADFTLDMNIEPNKEWERFKAVHMIAYGFTLTGRDDLEPGASSNVKRVNAMRLLKMRGYRTFSSLEPVIDPMSTLKIFYESMDCCDLFKVGLQSGRSLASYDRGEVERMAEAMASSGKKLYFKKSLTDYLGWAPQEPVDIFSIDR